MNKQIGFMKDMREQKTHKVFWSALVVVLSMVMWCPQSFAEHEGGVEPGHWIRCLFYTPLGHAVVVA